MIIPWRVDVPEERYPFFNWAIITTVIVAFVFQTISIEKQKSLLPEKIKEYENRPVEDMAENFGVEQDRLREIKESAEKAVAKINEIIPQKDTSEFKNNIVKGAILEEYFVWGKIRPFILNGWKIKGLFGHIWLHAGILHLLGNMLFLWIFGNAVCAKIGNLRFFPIYIGLGLLAGVTYLIFVGGLALGASGAINGIVGMFLVFFPQNEITCFWVFLPVVRQFCISSYWMILLWLFYDIAGLALSDKTGGGIAYVAHVGGFAGGFFLAILMLKYKWVAMERYEKSLLDFYNEWRNPSQQQPQFDPRFGHLQRELQQLNSEVETVKSEVEVPPAPEININPFALEPPDDGLIRFTCSCGKRFKVPQKLAGKTGRCPKCNSRMTIPDK